MSKTTPLHVHLAFFYICLPPPAQLRHGTTKLLSCLADENGKVMNYYLSLNSDAVPLFSSNLTGWLVIRAEKILGDAKSIFHRSFHWRRGCRIVRSLVRLRNRTAGRRGRQNVCEGQTWEGYYLHVLSRSSLNINVFWSFTNRSV